MEDTNKEILKAEVILMDNGRCSLECTGCRGR